MLISIFLVLAKSSEDNKSLENIPIDRFCYNLDQVYVEIITFKYLLEIIENSILNMRHQCKSDFIKKLFMSDGKEIYLNETNYCEIVLFHVKYLIEFFEANEFFRNEEGYYEKNRVFIKNLSNFVPDICAGRTIYLPEIRENLKYYDFFEQLYENSALFLKLRNDILDTFFRNNFFVDENLIFSIMFLNNINSYLSVTISYLITSTLTNKCALMDFEDSCLLIDLNRMSTYIKNAVDYCRYRNSSTCNLFFKCSKDIFITDILTNSYKTKSIEESENKLTSQPNTFKNSLKKKTEEFLARSLKVNKPNLGDKNIAKKILKNNYDLFKIFLNELSKKSYKTSRQLSSKKTSKEITQEEKPTKLNSLDCENSDEIQQDFKPKIYNDGKICFYTCPNLKTLDNNKIKLCIWLEFFDIMYEETILDVVVSTEKNKTFSRSKIKFVNEIFENLEERQSLEKFAQIISSNIKNSIKKLYPCANINERVCKITNTFSMSSECSCNDKNTVHG
ncbi:hypothetical protein EDEG_01786 [Edhazardia aedis USNM 41457]|uniref:Uncharacterized protein n=1 Tax=Edhazardia aedis (strain USNM 41457) TaxID=1003232 RepID=J9DMY6_EDHAE|nr:hypothetical protein EDEG_01786 [Edhazardia aedis USNM 41457]|eukprot:EJW03930.1 hypothetical protein EDEG_01786 [Edhazardia aedis USNM 41457]